jgi:hypothetical protein
MDETLYVPNFEYGPIFDCLFGGLDPIQIQFHIEQYTQLVFNSIVRDSALEFDPKNTYDKTNLTFNEPGFFNNAPSPIGVVFTQGPNLIQYQHAVVIDVITPSAKIDALAPQPFTYVGNLSSYIDLPSGDQIRITGELPGGNFDFGIQNILPMRVDYRKRVNLIQGKEPLPWTDPDLRDVYVKEINWVDRLAAVVLQLAKANIRRGEE